jgi:hypothetical protein
VLLILAVVEIKVVAAEVVPGIQLAVVAVTMAVA